MSTWTLAQVRQVQRLWVDVWVADEALVVSGKRALTAAREQAARALVVGARTHAVEVHLADVAFDEGDDDTRPASRRIRARWAPRTRTVDLVGGTEDGHLLEVRDVEQPLRMAVAPSLTLADLSGSAWPEAALQTLTYRLAGWRETERRWAFAFDGVSA